MTGVICTPLQAEYRTLQHTIGASVVRTGRGPGGRLPERTAGRPSLVAGVAGSLHPDVAVGDLVVAERVIGDGGTEIACPSAALLAGSLRRHGLSTHVGGVISRSAVVHGTDRAALAAHGSALVVDTESAYLATQSASGQFAAVRVVTDAPGAELISLGMPARGIAALRNLRRAAPVLDRWAGAAIEREILLASPRSFRADVERAIDATCPLVNRQQAFRTIAEGSELMLVLGSPDSSNSCRLAEVAQNAGTHAELVDDLSAVELDWLVGTSRVGIAADASAPPHLVDDLVGCLSGLGRTTVRETTTISENVHFALP